LDDVCFHRSDLTIDELRLFHINELRHVVRHASGFVLTFVPASFILFILLLLFLSRGCDAYPVRRYVARHTTLHGGCFVDWHPAIEHMRP